MTLPRLCLVADGFASGRPELDAAAVAARAVCLVEAGVPWVALRDTGASDADFLHAATDLAERLRARRPGLVVSVHGRLDAAHHLDAVYHATAGGASVAEAVAAGLVAGASVHSATGGLRAARDGAAYVFFSPVFATRTHPDAAPAGIDALRRCVQHAGVPVIALGGMSPPRARLARIAGAHGAAAIAGLLFAWDPAATVPAFHRALDV